MLPARSEGVRRARARCRISAAVGGLSIIAAYGLLCNSQGSRKALKAPGLRPAVAARKAGAREGLRII
ncbi:Uncharacterised protein [Bordetella trematum]|nr:Uncharacterised protein [Bordetella trematum]VDH07007.1 Uncharacterised protein [Bordetella trematum]